MRGDGDEGVVALKSAGAGVVNIGAMRCPGRRRGVAIIGAVWFACAGGSVGERKGFEGWALKTSWGYCEGRGASVGEVGGFC